ncbi:cation transport protein-domain-containing protein [Aspergillus pseudotamarii]|uniref:Potassium transport protein n=1 Tax=Aspergillus pseudotamarii TaxID=132259 RepID=A0A5N6T3Q9_ASPPS|nr:cation transport protein-domain-containing protein [Aspergillus pseudotamarii]KAE8140841.1 cation transport protein-domain-containing protein [Aspergillus pseudotamarii]
MWKPHLNFITLHYAYIIFLSILALIVVYPQGNLSAVDAYFFGASASTESGLNTVDVKELRTYQQVYLYLIPILGNLGFINILVVVVRLRWFQKRFEAVAPKILGPKAQDVVNDPDLEEKIVGDRQDMVKSHQSEQPIDSDKLGSRWPVSPSQHRIQVVDTNRSPEIVQEDPQANGAAVKPLRATTISFAEDVDTDSKALYIPPPRERDRGYPILEVDDSDSGDLDLDRAKSTTADSMTLGSSRRYLKHRLSSTTIPLERIASRMFTMDPTPSHSQLAETLPRMPLSKDLDLPSLSSKATVGRNSQFHNLTERDRELLGGIEYRSLKLLLKIVTAYFLGLHLFGAICLVGWIQHADPKYRQYLEECGQGNVWWGFYSAQTMVNNLGFTLTPDSMISFREATFPMILMSFLAYAGNTCYPCMLRLVIWVMLKLCPKQWSVNEPLTFLLKHPRRCYTLLFPSRPTWALFGILFAMNFVDILLILVLDLNNPEVNSLAAGPRILAAIFQAASSRHTGTATFNLADVNPAVQFSLVVMMYVAVFPIAISVRASNTYEESSLGLYPFEAEIDERNGGSYIMTHIRNQLTFDLWYIFLGIFCICIAEADKIADTSIPAFAVFPVLFEVVSAYGNVGLSLGYPTVSTSLSGEFTTFSKLVICAMMIRGRHRMLPYKLDRAILLPNERLSKDDEDEIYHWPEAARAVKLTRYHTS